MTDPAEQQVTVVLGGTSGIGAEIVRHSIAAGDQVVFQGRNPDRGAALEALAREAGSALFVPADLYNYSEVRRVLETAVERFGRVDSLVASGGSFDPAPLPFSKVTADSIPAYFETRLFHRLYAIHAGFAVMSRQGSGSIVALTTDAGRIPTPAESLVGGAAAALVFMIGALAKEFAPAGVRLNAVSLSLTRDTPSYDAQQSRIAAAATDDLTHAFNRLEHKAAFGLAEPSDVAAFVLFLCSAQAGRLSGATVSLNGGASFPRY